MRTYHKTLLCVILNWIELLPTLIFLISFSEILEIGPSEKLFVLGIKINTWGKYISLIFLSSLNKSLDVFIHNLGGQNIKFLIYDPNLTTIYGFSKPQLHTLSNVFAISKSLNLVFRFSIIVSRVDVAIFSFLTGNFVDNLLTGYLLSKKEFFEKFESKEEHDNSKLPLYETSENDFTR